MHAYACVGMRPGSDDSYINSSMLGPKEFREVLRFLAMDEPPMLPDSTTTDVTAPSQVSRKRKFVEVPIDGLDVETVEGTGSSRQLGAMLVPRCSDE
jgi:hypothetical protein